MGPPVLRLGHRGGHQRINLTIDQVPVDHERRSRRHRRRRRDDDGGFGGGREEEEEEHKNNYNFKAASDNDQNDDDDDDEQAISPTRQIRSSVSSTEARDTSFSGGSNLSYGSNLFGAKVHSWNSG